MNSCSTLPHVHTHSGEQSLLVVDLEPNTKYEFAVRLHLEQLASPWSPVVYQSTLPDGEHHTPRLVLLRNGSN